MIYALMWCTVLLCMPGVVAGTEQAQPSGMPPPDQLVLEIPRSRNSVAVGLGEDGTMGFRVAGHVSRLLAGHQLMLWVRPVKPAADRSWYLQQPPGSGIDSIDDQGHFDGRAQLGKAEWPPRAGHTFDVAVSLVSEELADSLLAIEGPVTTRVLVGPPRASAQVVRVSRISEGAE